MAQRRGKYRRRTPRGGAHQWRDSDGALPSPVLTWLTRALVRAWWWLIGGGPPTPPGRAGTDATRQSLHPSAAEHGAGSEGHQDAHRKLHPAVAARRKNRPGRAPLPPMRDCEGPILSPPGMGGAVSGGPMPYRRAKRLLSRGERAFWYPLYKAVEGRYRIFCKVRLADVVDVPAGGGWYWFRRIRGFHVDFVLCDPDTTAPRLVVELDDRSHRSDRARKQDAIKDEVLRAAGLPVYRVPCQEAYDPAELAERIGALIASGAR